VHYGHRAPAAQDITHLYSVSRDEGFGAEVKRRIMLGTYALSAGYADAFYQKALRVRRLIRDEFIRAFEQADVLISPVAPMPAFRIGEKRDDPLQMYLADIYTTGANLAGLPAISIPCGFTRAGLPIGLQLLAPAFAESRLLAAARYFESRTHWHTRIPPIE
jgi:aspartyl-tRNA(Asn)/glutamyl-tRNA(Gln) amidotransferase subunit A